MKIKLPSSGAVNLVGLPIIHSSGYVCPLPPKHRFPMPKFDLIMNVLKGDGVVKRGQIATPDLISGEDAESVHTAEYVHKFFGGKTTADEQRITGFPWSDGLVSRVRMETGGTVLASALARERGLACSTAGGTHHAFPSYGAGYCLINDLAVAAKLATCRVLIVDLDVHQGDGTAAIFQNDPSVFTFSMHAAKNFPFRKQLSDLDVPLPNDLQDDEYLTILQHNLEQVLGDFKPELVLYDAGVDVHKNDELGKLRLTDDGIFKRDYCVIDRVVRSGTPIASVIGGGYSDDLNELALRHTIVHRAATKVWNQRGL